MNSEFPWPWVLAGAAFLALGVAGFIATQPGAHHLTRLEAPGELRTTLEAGRFVLCHENQYADEIVRYHFDPPGSVSCSIRTAWGRPILLERPTRGYPVRTSNVPPLVLGEFSIPYRGTYVIHLQRKPGCSGTTRVFIGPRPGYLYYLSLALILGSLSMMGIKIGFWFVTCGSEDIIYSEFANS